MTAVEELKCPNCGAPIDYHGGDAPTLKCPYCSTVVIVPEELRPRKVVKKQTQAMGQPEIAGERSPGCTIALIVGVVLFIAATIFIPLYLNGQDEAAALAEEQNALATASARETLQAVPTFTPAPTITPTPAWAYPVNSFGQKGIGAGMFDDARSIAIDGEGFLYVADYQGGRVQRFDPSGKYLSQIRVGSEKTIISALVADRQGTLFVSNGGAITAYDGVSGAKRFEIRDPRGGDYGGLFATDDGQLAAIWYQARWGLITSLEGHREELVFFDGDGKAVKTAPSFLSDQTDSVVLDAKLAVDGSGKLYALSFGEIYVYAPSGKYLNKFSLPSEPGQAMSFSSLAVDGQGRLYLGSSSQIYILSPEGRPVDTIPVQGYVDDFAIDRRGHIYAVAREQVIELAPRDK